jgi:hypothetical protein
VSLYWLDCALHPSSCLNDLNCTRLESVAAGLLNRFLKTYVDNLNTSQLNIGIWSGDVRLKNLKLKKEALDKFRLPVDVKEGYLGDLTLNIPWNNVSMLSEECEQPALLTAPAT